MKAYVNLLESKRDGTLYLGVTRDLGRRVDEHKRKLTPGFSSRYCVDRLVWYEVYVFLLEAITREKQIKKWRRAWKVALIDEMNPDWADLPETLNS